MTAHYGCRIDYADGVAELVLTDQDRGNLIGIDLATSLVAALGEIPAEARTVLLRAEGSSFCFGGKLSEFGTDAGRAERIIRTADAAHAFLHGYRALPIPTISLIHGWAAGGGIGLGLIADIVIATASARFRPAYSRIALAPDCGTSWHIARAFGEHRSQALMLADGEFDAAEALRVGLVSEVVDDETALERARELAAGFARGSADSLRLIRDTVRSAFPGYDEHLARERAAMLAAASGPDAAEGIGAFLERRSPDYRHPGV